MEGYETFNLKHRRCGLGPYNFVGTQGLCESDESSGVISCKDQMVISISIFKNCLCCFVQAAVKEQLTHVQFS